MPHQQTALELEQHPIYIAWAILASAWHRKNAPKLESNLCKEILPPNVIVEDPEEQYQKAWYRFQHTLNQYSKMEVFALVHQVIRFLEIERKPFNLNEKLMELKNGNYCVLGLAQLREQALEEAMYNHQKKILMDVLKDADTATRLLPENIRSMIHPFEHSKAIHYYIHECTANGQPVFSMSESLDLP